MSQERDINAPHFSYFDEFPELLENYPELFGLSAEDWNITIDQSILDIVEGPSNIDTTEVPSTLDTTEVPSTLDATEVPSNIEAQSGTTALLQQPAPSIRNLFPGITPYADPRRATWNVYRCDQCKYASKFCGDVTRHIRQRRPDHDPYSVSVTWVGDDDVKIARGFISGEIFMTRVQRLAREDQERKAGSKMAQEEREDKRAGTVKDWVNYDPSYFYDAHGP
ncbi:hypothetical protein BGX38DRAFT_1297150 [Terfezia claveryi]|nr:hypothetical protein BGX38DRAFT_1297150 [Terfezia claveryi]